MLIRSKKVLVSRTTPVNFRSLQAQRERKSCVSAAGDVIAKEPLARQRGGPPVKRRVRRRPAAPVPSGGDLPVESRGARSPCPCRPRRGTA